MSFSKFILLLVSVLFATLQSSAQSISEARQILEYTSRFEPIQQEAYAVWMSVDELSVSVNEFHNGDISLSSITSRILEARHAVETKTLSAQRLLNELPSAPSGTSSLHERLVDYPQEVSDFIAEGEIAANSVIDALEGSVSGDVDAMKKLDELALVRASLLVEFSNRSLERDIASIPTTDHPQIYVLRNTICTNNVSLQLGRLDFAFAYGQESEMLSLKNKIARDLEACRSIISQGRRAQLSNLKEFEGLESQSSPDEREFLDKVRRMMRSYDAAWEAEKGLVNSIAELVEMFSEAPSYPELEAQWARIYEYEEKRGQLIFERMSLLQ